MGFGAIGVSGIGTDRILAFLFQHVRSTGLAGSQKGEVVRRGDHDMVRVWQAAGKIISVRPDIDRTEAIGVAEVYQRYLWKGVIQRIGVYRSAKARIDGHGACDASVTGIAGEPRMIAETHTPTQEEPAIGSVGTSCTVYVLCCPVELQPRQPERCCPSK